MSEGFLESAEEYIAEVHVHLLPLKESRGSHHFIDSCPCNPFLEIEQDDEDNEVLYIYHRVVH
jgi:hypothetical protein